MLKFNDLCQYLPYGLQVQYDQTDWVLDSLIFGNETAVIGKEDEQEAFVPISQIKPYFRPLTQLVEEIYHNGKKFVPIVELAQTSGLGFENFAFVETSDNGLNFQASYEIAEFIFQKHTFYAYINYNIIYVENQKALFDKLIEWHFWLGDQSLFETGEILTLPAK